MLAWLVLLAAGFVVAQESAAPSDHSKHNKNAVTLQGCVSRSSGDYVLIKQNPAMSYELQAAGKFHLRDYLGQRVEITGRETPTMSSSSDALNKTGSASPVTIEVHTIKTLAKDCPERQGN
jgi:hypothetical protein